MAWQFSISFSADEEDHIRDTYPHDSTADLQDTVKQQMKDAVLTGYDERGDA